MCLLKRVCTRVYPSSYVQLRVGFVGDPETATDPHQVQGHARDLGGVEDPVLPGNTRHHHVYKTTQSDR